MPEAPRKPQATTEAGPDPATSIDRIAPTRRPAGLSVMRQRWRELLFLHWASDPAAIRPLIPDGLDLDLFEGQAYIGLVAFTMEGVRPVGLPPIRPLSNFHETNVRTYVHFGGRDPGVWFFSLDAASRVAVRLARGLFHLPYRDAALFLEREAGARVDGSERGSILYAGVRRRLGPLPASYLIRAAATGPAAPAVPGTLEHFLVERYYLYCRRAGQFYRGQVHHAPYPLRRAAILSLDENLLAAAGLDRPSQPPLAHYAAGVDVEVFRLHRAGQPVR
jgi:uncharacterized protein YqjF (DUF2071 family)